MFFKAVFLIVGLSQVLALPTESEYVPADLVENVLRDESELISVDESNVRIVSGWQAYPGQHPHQIYLRMVDAAGALSACGGSVVHENWFITAAHCTALRVRLLVRAGLVHILQPQYDAETTVWYNHPTFVNELAHIVQPNDISIAHVSQPFKFNHVLQPIRIQASADAYKDYGSQQVIASGFGRTWTGDVDYVHKVVLLCSCLEFLVLDEADRLLDLGFSSTLTTILQYLPRQRRTGLFSATQTKQLQDLVRAGLRNPVVVSVKEKSTISTPLLLENYYVIVEPQDKFLFLLNFIRNRKIVKGLFFLPTCACVDYWADVLPAFLPDVKVFAIHGKMKQKRSRVLEKFRESDGTILLCTDLLARGLDIPEVEWVLQWEPPTHPAQLVHRVGRAARGGAAGCSLLPLLPAEDAYVAFIQANQKVELKDWRESGDEIKITQKLRDKVASILHDNQKRDRAVLDKGQRAFVSHMRAYSKHECNLLLQFKQLPLGHIATSYGLLKLPLMPELKQDHKDQFVGPSREVDLNSIPYQNKQKEASRLLKLAEFRKTGVWPSKKKKKMVKSQPWEQAKQNKEEKKERRKKRIQVKQEGKKGKKRRAVTQEELDELAADVALMKKLKKRKITKEQFDEQFDGD